MRNLRKEMQTQQKAKPKQDGEIAGRHYKYPIK